MRYKQNSRGSKAKESHIRNIFKRFGFFLNVASMILCWVLVAFSLNGEHELFFAIGSFTASVSLTISLCFVAFAKKIEVGNAYNL